MLESNILENSITDPAIVEQLIPHKAPFVMIDKVLFYSNNKVIGGLTITADNIFTKENTFIEPGLIEHMAQSVAIHTGYHYYLKNEAAPVGYLGSIKKVDIHQLPKVGDEVVTTVHILKEILGVTMVTISAKIGDIEIASAEMKTVKAS